MGRLSSGLNGAGLSCFVLRPWTQASSDLGSYIKEQDGLAPPIPPWYIFNAFVDVFTKFQNHLWYSKSLSSGFRLFLVL